MFDWIVWNRTVLKFNCVLMLNWIVWNRIVYMYKIDMVLDNLQRLICQKPKKNKQNAGKAGTNSWWHKRWLIRKGLHL